MSKSTKAVFYLKIVPALLMQYTKFFYNTYPHIVSFVLLTLQVSSNSYEVKRKMPSWSTMASFITKNLRRPMDIPPGVA